MTFSRFISRIHKTLAARRRWVLTGTGLLLTAAVIWSLNVRIEEDISSMIPRDGSSAAKDFAYLRQSPFLSKILITLEAGSQTSTRELASAGKRLAKALDPALFSNVLAGPPKNSGPDFIVWALEHYGSLATKKDLQQIQSRLSRDQVEKQLKQTYALLAGPAGTGFKEIARRDPLNLRDFLLPKFGAVNPVPKVRIRHGAFVSEDGTNAIIIAETPVPMTDSKGSEKLLEVFSRAVKQAVPGDIQVSMLSGHRYTLANARAIKRDLTLILTFSSLAILGLFMLFLRTREGVYVFLLPLAVISLGVCGVSLFFPRVSGITLGFGAVILGISVDYGLHVYFALRSGEGEQAKRLGQVAGPVLYGGLTTLGAFSILLFSRIPGQQQLAVFSMTSLAAALLLAVLILPLFLTQNKIPPSPLPIALQGGMEKKKSGLVLVVWFLCMGFFLWQGLSVRFSGNLRSLALMPPQMERLEKDVRSVWGDMRNRAMIFASGKNLSSALEANDEVYNFLRDKVNAGKIMSLSPLLSSPELQKQRQKAWMSFWDSRRKQIQNLIEEEGRKLGFAPGAFTPFYGLISEKGEIIRPEDFSAIGLQDPLRMLLSQDGPGYRIISLLPDDPGLIEDVQATMSKDPDIHLVSQSKFQESMSDALRHDFFRFIRMASAVVILLLLFKFGNIKKLMASLLPVISGLIVLTGVMALLGMDFNLYNVVATILIIGLGVDYGIFMVSKLEQGHELLTERAILVSGLTTLAGFGGLVLAKHPALHSLGLTVLLGMMAAVPTALFVIPAFLQNDEEV